MVNIFSPLTLSENLAKIAQKIDFSKTNGEDVKKEPSESESKDEETKDTSAQSLWPWDTVRTSLRYVLLKCNFKNSFLILIQKFLFSTN